MSREGTPRLNPKGETLTPEIHTWILNGATVGVSSSLASVRAADCELRFTVQSIVLGCSQGSESVQVFELAMA